MNETNQETFQQNSDKETEKVKKSLDEAKQVNEIVSKISQSNNDDDIYKILKQTYKCLKDENIEISTKVYFISEVISKDCLIVTGSSGLAVEVFYTAFKNKKGQRMFLTSGLGSMGYGLPAAIGACIGSGRAPTICVESDGSLMLNLQELATLKQTFSILNDARNFFI
jgi:thiamine pyrophosphate-dependent acetolactate synthase large subunit-like protein